MGGSSVPTSEPHPDCLKCGRPMVRRTARRGANAGSKFWGCSEFPRCRGIVQHEPPVDAPADEDASAPVQRAQANAEETTAPDAGDKARGLLTRVVQTVDKGWRWYLESDQPDATGRWGDAHRRRMLSYIHTRDGGRCGLCAGETKQQGAQIEHIVPKVFAVFDVGKVDKAEPGTQYKSRLYKIGNLHAAHTHCNKRKGNTPEVAKWRHPAMPPLTVADTHDGRVCVLPRHLAPLRPGLLRPHRGRQQPTASAAVNRPRLHQPHQLQSPRHPRDILPRPSPATLHPTISCGNGLKPHRTMPRVDTSPARRRPWNQSQPS